jgi:hypothetical protein
MEDGRQLASSVKGGVTSTYVNNKEGIRLTKPGGGVAHNYRLLGDKIVEESWVVTALSISTMKTELR